ncbi:MAG: hypothetical protein HYV09_31970 [Deltaproteobacteria bacterium]|nr:hypothetical protein [Deltaproteobacteria bacterium]
MRGLDVVHMTATLLVPVFAWAVARTQRAHIALAGYLTWIAAAEIVRTVVLTPLRRGETHPLHGVALVALQCDRALTLSWQLLFLACVLHYFLGRGARLAVLGWVIASAAAIVGYPGNAATFPQMYSAIHNPATAIAWLAIVFAILRRRRLAPTISHVVLMIYAAADAVVTAFPLLSLPLDLRARWLLVVVCNVTAIAAVIIAHVVVLFRARSDAPTTGAVPG